MSQNKQQVMAIHGGDTFTDYSEYLQFLKDFPIEPFYQGRSWRSRLAEDLGEDYEVFLPSMPNKTNARYEEWKIWFEKYLPYLRPELILIGHSLGATFLVKYLAEEKLPFKLKALFLISAPFGDSPDYVLGDFSPPSLLSQIKESSDNIFLFHSRDDEIVPFADLDRYAKILTDAKTCIFEDRGHFNQESLPEILELIKNLKFE